MVDQRIAEDCACALETLLESLFENAAMTPVRSFPGAFYGYDALIGQLFITGEDHSAHRLRICKALIADARFRQEVGIPLPLRREDIRTLVDDDDPRLNIVGLYAGSQRSKSWRADHPGFAEFVSGLMAHDDTPIEICEDLSLRRQFPPRQLEGLCSDGLHLYWNSPETITMCRDVDRMCAAAVAAGTIPP